MVELVENWREVEERAVEILTKEGFEDVYYLPGDGFDRMPFDYLARKDGLNFAINVTTYRYGSQKKRHKRLAAWCGWVPIFLCVKPDFSGYRFVESATYNVIKASKDDLERLYWEKGMTIQQIADELKVCSAAVFRKLKKYGIATRKRRPSAEFLAAAKKVGFKKGHVSWCKDLTKETDERVRRMSENCGHVAWNKGIHVQTNTGRTHFKKGFTPWNKGKKGCFSEETIGKMSEAKRVKSRVPQIGIAG